jgi:hypothetical protein
MTPDTCHQASESSSPNLTVRSVRFDVILRLGEQIVASLEANDRVDMLTSWMAHYIAQLMQAAEEAIGEERTKKQTECADAILSLWDHRHRLPSGMRPFEELEAIFAALQRLDPQIETQRYFHLPRLAASEDPEGSEVARWLGMADALDYSARILIRYCLGCAAGAATEKSRKWVELAEEVGSGSTIELPIIRIITGERDLLETDDPIESERKLLEDRIGKLDAFKDLAVSVAAHLRSQLQQIHGSSDPAASDEAVP